MSRRRVLIGPLTTTLLAAAGVGGAAARASAAAGGVPGTGDDSHTIGTVLVAPDHSVFVGVGDGSSYLQPDVSATNAQDIDSVRGKIFHINANGQGLTTNPFYRGDVNEVRAKVY